jgi:hypothetical protein
MNRPSDQSDLLLLAFRYVSGELPAQEAATFEERLAGDQDACEALADAVELCEVVAIGAADSVMAPARSSRPSRRKAAAVLAGSLASVAAIVAVGTQLADRGADREQRYAAHQASSLLSMWRHLRNQEGDGNDRDLDEDGSNVEASDEIPDWMFTALATTAGDEAIIPSPPNNGLDEDELNLNL